MKPVSGLLSNQREKSIHFFFIMVPLRKKVNKVGYSKAQVLLRTECGVLGLSASRLGRSRDSVKEWNSTLGLGWVWSLGFRV